MKKVSSKLQTAYRNVRWYVRGVVGADAYEKYVRWCEHTGHEPMDEKTFWRDKCDREEKSPGMRCC
ncbi:hypothetical protein BK816_04090 [Boudabousia tangfeifanii]|uniref:YbdD/YjiX family protein n=1 Tax=Boudabousia tangfeifanii TaxID=1912795 RepID=A0A1D9MJW2_9ACTO|nr:YbdD/YjiX family protein [Boudabousia tangfeifanii]AOZ72576.1 hypothetical protein BK816_04090 [Boudabousia tangfeifanii]